MITVRNLLLEVADVEDGVEERSAWAVKREAQSLHASVETCAVNRIAEVLVKDELRADELVERV